MTLDHQLPSTGEQGKPSSKRRVLLTVGTAVLAVATLVGCATKNEASSAAPSTTSVTTDQSNDSAQFVSTFSKVTYRQSIDINRLFGELTSAFQRGDRYALISTQRSLAVNYSQLYKSAEMSPFASAPAAVEAREVYGTCREASSSMARALERQNRRATASAQSELQDCNALGQAWAARWVLSDSAKGPSTP
jgi:hypothetical protein